MNLVTDSRTEILYKKSNGYTISYPGQTVSNEFAVQSTQIIIPSKQITWSQEIPDKVPISTELTQVIPYTQLSQFGSTGYTQARKYYITNKSYIVQYEKIQLTTKLPSNAAFTLYSINYTTPSTYTNSPTYNMLVKPILSYGVNVHLFDSGGNLDTVASDNATTSWYYDSDNGIITFYGNLTRLANGNPLITFWRYEGTTIIGSNSSETTNATSNTGPTGEAGKDGVTGPTGAAGRDGPTGPPGSGTSDYSGGVVFLGNTGTSGVTGIYLQQDTTVLSGKKLFLGTEPTSDKEAVTKKYVDDNIIFSNNWSQLGNDINGELMNDESGYSVSLSDDGTIVAIGAPFNDGKGADSGHCRVYRLGLTGGVGTTGWIKIGQDIDGEATGDQSGFSVYLSGDGTSVAIGAPFNGSHSGHCRVYRLGLTGGVGTTGWIQLGQDIDGEASLNQSGYSVSLSTDGTIVASSSIYNNGINGSYSGHCRVYRLGLTGGVGTTGWIKIGQDIDGEAADDLSGRSVSLSGDGTTIAIGARSNYGNGSGSGHCRVYKVGLTGGVGTTGWIKIGQDIDGEAAGDSLGQSVSLSYDGTIVAVGAIFNSSQKGHCRVYKVGLTGGVGTTGWIQLGQDIDGEARLDQSGFSVSLSKNGDFVAIGAPFNDGNGNNSGHCRVYQYGLTGWFKILDDIDGNSSSRSGRSVCLSGDGSIVAIGAPYTGENNISSGICRVYKASINIDINKNNVFKNLSTNIAGGNINLNSTTTNLNSTTTNLNSTTTNLNSTTTNLNSTTTNLNSTTTNLNSTTINSIATDIINTVSNGFAMIARYITFNSASGGSSQIDLNFCTSTTNPSAVTSAIYASGGTTTLTGNISVKGNTFTSDTTTTNLTSRFNNITGSLKLKSFGFSSGNLLDNYIIQTGKTAVQPALSQSQVRNATITFTQSFAIEPFVIAVADYVELQTVNRVCISISGTSSTGFTWNAYNPTNAQSPGYRVSYIAIGQI
jgi:hypothetical protein